MATLDEVYNDITNGLNTLKNDVLREVALDVQTKTRKRIFTDGIKADGNKIGEYSPVTEAIKRKKGRFTSSKVNLRDTEKLVNSYVVEPKGKKYVIGFVSASRSGVTNTAKKENLENKYGNDLFEPMEKEIEEAVENVIKLIEF